MYSDTRTDVHAIHIEKNIYNSHLNCGNDEKNQRFYNNKFGSYNPIWINYYNTKQHTSVHRFRYSINYFTVYLTIITENIY